MPTMSPQSPAPSSSSLTILFTLITTACLLLHHLHRRLRPKLQGKQPPGPTPLPIIGNLHLLGHLPNRTLQALSQKYGPIMSFRLGSVPGIVVSSSEAAELFLKTYDHVFASRPSLQVSEILSYNNKGLAFQPYGPYWRTVRKMCTSHLLSPSKIGSFLPTRREKLRSLVAELRVSAAQQEVVNVSKKVGQLIGDLACQMVLGCSTEEVHDLEGIIHEAMSLFGAFNLADYVPLLRPFDLQGFTRRMKLVSPAIDKLLEEILDKHEQNINLDDKKDFVDTLLSILNEQSMDKSSNNEQEYTIDRTNIKAILLDMIAGSYDTSGTVIEWALSEIVKKPQVLSHLQEELKITIGMNKMVEEEDLPKLSYLHMVVKETLRLHPVGALIPIESTEDVTINGYHIGKKSRIMVNVWAIGRDTKAWSNNAQEFLPERFINNDMDVKGKDFMLIPFGSGRRRCPGMQLGLVNVKLVLAQLVHCFNWELPIGMSTEDLDMTEEFGLSTPRAKPLLLMPTYRLHV